MQLALDVPRPPALPRRPAPRPATCACERCERTRVREHLLGAIEQMLASPGTTTEARVARASLIAELVRYAVRGVFPRNETAPEQKVPIFVDRIGTRCAVAHLLDHTGEHELVDDVARAANGELVAELARDARLRSWLDDWHLTEAEAARIQPCYNCPDLEPAGECVCALSSFAGLVIGTVSIPDDGEPYLTVEAAYGQATASPGDVVTALVDEIEDGANEGVYDGARVIANKTSPAAHLIFLIAPDGDQVLTLSYARGCQPITSCPETAPLQAFIDVAEGASCDETFGQLEGWERQEGDAPCNSSYGTAVGAGSSSSTQASAGVGGGAVMASSSASTAAATTAGGGGAGGAGPEGGSSDGCGCGVGPGALDPTTQGLLWALTAGLMLARRRR